MHQKVHKITTFFLRAQKINPKNYKNSHFANSTLQNHPNLHISKIYCNFAPQNCFSNENLENLDYGSNRISWR